jgi:hypothetical protein
MWSTMNWLQSGLTTDKSQRVRELIDMEELQTGRDEETDGKLQQVNRILEFLQPKIQELMSKLAGQSSTQSSASGIRSYEDEITLKLLAKVEATLGRVKEDLGATVRELENRVEELASRVEENQYTTHSSGGDVRDQD